MNKDFFVIRDEISRFHGEKESVILSELSTQNYLNDWLNFNGMNFTIRHDVLKIIAKACTCTADEELHCEFVRRLVSLKAAFVAFVSVLLSVMQTEQTDCDIAAILKLIFDVVHSVFSSVPVSSTDFIDLILPQLLLILKKYEIKNELIFNVTHLLEQRNNYQSGNQSESEKIASKCNFRQVTLLPDKKEIENQEKPYLRANIVRGSYKSVNHYLDVQFRLLREDMFRYLRESIIEYKSREWPRNISALLQNGNLYFDARVSSRIYHNGVLFVADVPIGKEVDWNSRKMLIPNSLLCMSCDGFQTFVFGIVHYRAPSVEDSLSCYLEFSAVNNNVECIQLGKTYDIIETTAFYESYKYVLNRLQVLGPQSFPLPESILFLEDCDEKPEYWTNCSNLRDAFEKVPELSEFKGFDEHQQQAFRMAISNRVSVIQGPPGTGKTYLGLQIVRWLLQNASQHMRAPILVICYTNHALDQFLEGALKFTNKVVRIGGQSKSIALEPHNIHSIIYSLQKEMRRRNEEERNRFYSSGGCRFCGKKRPGYCNMKKDLYQSIYYEDTHQDDDHFSFCICDEDCSKSWSDADFENPKSESLRVGLKLIGDFTQLRSAGLYTSEIKQTEKELEKIEKLINGLDTRPIYDETVLAELLKENIWQEVLCCSNIYSGKWKTLLKFVVKRLESWLCLTATFLYVYEDFPRLLILIMENFLAYVEENGYLDRKLNMTKQKCASVQQQTTTAPENLFILGLLEMFLKLGNPPCVNATHITLSEVSNSVQYFLEEHILDKNVIFKAVEKSASKYLEQNCNDTVSKSSQIWEVGLLCRWKIFFKWKSDAKQRLLEKLKTLQEFYLDGIAMREGTRLQNNIKIAKNADVLGLTTTGAAKHWELLEQVGPVVVVAEEAAEVLEAHITTALTKATQHLILIGDHKQLRPIPTVYDLAKRFKLDVSMFERLLINGAPSHCLQTQHRMRPIIAELLVPEIYENLENHSSVLEYEEIEGMATNMYFVKHEVHEDTSHSLRSHRNRHEAEFLISLCRYLLQQGYKKNSITILTTYVGQLRFLNEAMNKELETAVQVTTVDNFQGEENDIILLSFVRSNPDNNLGFLEISNRVCVALSRARKGLYCIGNFDSFAEKCDIWNKIVSKLKNMELISAALPLKCQNHPQKITLVSRARDFRKVILGGCAEKCARLLACGHVCPLQCHLGKRTHAEMCCSDDYCLTRCQKANVHIVKVLSSISEEFSFKEWPSDTKEDCENECTHNEVTMTCMDQCSPGMLPFGIDTFYQTSGVKSSLVLNSCISSRVLGVSEYSENRLDDGKHELSSLCESETFSVDELPISSLESANFKVACSAELFAIKDNGMVYMTADDASSFITECASTDSFQAGTIYEKTGFPVSSGFPDSESEHNGIVHSRSVAEMDPAVSKMIMKFTDKDWNDFTQENCQRDLKKKSEQETSSTSDSLCDEQPLYEGKDELFFSDTKLRDGFQDLGSCDHLNDRSSLCEKHVLKKLQCQHEIQVICSEYHLQHECKVEVDVQLPCLHSVSVMCKDWKWVKQMRCLFKESLLMPCGQLIQYTCSDGPDHADCTALILKCGHKVACYIDAEKYKCEVPIRSVLPCSHVADVPCTLHYFSQKAAGDTSMQNRLLLKMCQNECEVLMKCGHKCSGKCIVCTENSVHMECREKVQKLLSCGHTVECECHVKSPLCPAKCGVSLECGHVCSGKCGTCGGSKKHSDCRVVVPKTLFCGHMLECECHVEDPYCPVKCETTLSCKHQCPSQCGHCLKFRIHGKCPELVYRCLPCGHSVHWPCGSPLPVCERRCLFRCEHSRCINSCQYQCIKCYKPCEWKCEHYTCTMLCSELCNRPPCNVRCPKVLKCGHQCAGYCGEPCPNLCVQCDRNSVVNTDQCCNLYVLLEDCQHEVLAEDMNLYFKEKSPSSCPQCPQCGTVISKNIRYGNFIKSWLVNYLHNYNPEIYTDRDESTHWSSCRESSIFQNFVSEMIQTNISLLCASTAMKMCHNVCILRCLMSSRQSLLPDYKGLAEVSRSLEQWLLQHGAVCSGQQVEESCRAVRRLCTLWFLKKFTGCQAKKNANAGLCYSEITTLLETKPFGDYEEQQLMEILHKEQKEGKSSHAGDLVSFIEYLNAVQKSPSYQEIDVSKYIGSTTRSCIALRTIEKYNDFRFA